MKKLLTLGIILMMVLVLSVSCTMAEISKEIENLPSSEPATIEKVVEKAEEVEEDVLVGVMVQETEGQVTILDPAVTIKPKASVKPLQTVEPISNNIKKLSPIFKKPDVFIVRPFEFEDWQFAGVKCVDNPDTVGEILGDPNSIESKVWGATGDTHVSYLYDFGTLSFFDDGLESVHVTKAGYPGPRGITIGTHIDDITPLFCSGEEKSNSNETIFYRHNTGRNNWLTLSPYGHLVNYGSKRLGYSWCLIQTYEDAPVEELESFIPYQYHYSFTMIFDDNDRVESYYLGTGADAE